MKNLKIKFGLFSLLAVLAVSVFLTSCEQTEIVSNEIETVQDITPSDLLVLPTGYDDDAEFAQNYVDNASDEEIETMTENHRVIKFVESKDKLGQVLETLEYGQNISESNLSNVLSEIELTELATYTIGVEERYTCSRVYLGGQYCTSCPYYYCHWAQALCCVWTGPPSYGSYSCYYVWYVEC